MPDRLTIFFFTHPIIASVAVWPGWLFFTRPVARASLSAAICVVLLHGCTDAKALTPTVSPSASVEEGIRDKDLGQLTEGDPMQYTFQIRNTANNPFTITAIKKSCGCETANVTEGMIVPVGELLSVPYSIPAHGAGTRQGQLVITTDASDEQLQKIVLTLRAEIQPIVWASPTQVMFGSVMEGQSATQEVRVESILPGLRAPDGELDPRWQAIIAVGEFVESDPEKVWEFSARWGRSGDDDLRSAIATCLLEHLLEHHFDLIFPRMASLAEEDRNFAQACLDCWEFGESKQPDNALILKRLKSKIRRAA